MLDAAIILCGNCSSSAVWLEKVILTGTTNDTVSRNIKKEVAVKYPIRRGVFALTRSPLKVIEENYLSLIEKTLQ